MRRKMGPCLAQFGTNCLEGTNAFHQRASADQRRRLVAVRIQEPDCFQKHVTADLQAS